MKKLFIIIITFFIVAVSFAYCGKEVDNINDGIENTDSITVKNKMKITVGSKIFTAILYDNPTVTALKERLPLRVTMTDLNNNEKYYHFENPLPTNASNPGTIQNGDLMLYQNYSMVLFYKTFSSSYSYTKLGKIKDAVGLEVALRSRNITVTFELD